MFFDNETNICIEDWRSSDAFYLLIKIDFNPTEWINESDMTNEEKEKHKDYENCGGYLKERDTSECCNDWWNSLSMDEKCIIQNIPNFDAKKFYEITGIEV